MKKSASSSQQLGIKFSQNEPFSFLFSTATQKRKFLASQSKSRIRKGFLQYLSRLQELTSNRAPVQLLPLLPAHFYSPSRVLVAILEDGIAVRYEPQTGRNTNEVLILIAKSKLRDFVPRMTLGVVNMANSKGQPYPLPDDIQPLKFTLDVRSKEGVKLNTLVDAQPFQMVMQYQTKSKQTTSSTTVPKAELIRNRFELQLDGVKLHDPTSSKSSGRPFTTRARVKFPGFWDAVSIYQWAKKEDWLQADFESWADQHFFRVAFEVSSSEYSWLVSASQAKLRSHYTEVLSEFDGLLSKERVIEEELQTFLNSHPEILVPGFKRVIPKLALGAHITDFVIEDATSNYLLVELESPSQPLFIKTGHRSSSLTHAVGQVEDWIRYIQDNKATVNRPGF